MSQLEKINGIGPKTAQWLREVGIESENDIHRLGSVEIYKRLKAHRPKEVSLNALWGLEAVIMGIRWDQLPQDVKDMLKGEIGKS
jgi:DNA transformation protein